MERIVPMTQLRKTIARCLVEAKNTAAMLTTFDEIDMSSVLALREKYQECFTKQHGIKLGVMSFFAKAAIEGLRAFPAVNAETRGTDIVYKDHYDIGVAVGGGKGLVVPVVRGADRMSFADLDMLLGGGKGKGYTPARSDSPRSPLNGGALRSGPPGTATAHRRLT